MTQCAAVSTTRGATTVPPQYWPSKALRADASTSAAIHGYWPGPPPSR